MRILFVAHSSEFNGGANRSLFSIISSLAKLEGFEVEVLLPNAKGTMNKALDKESIKWTSYKYNILITKNTKGISGLLRIVNLNKKFLMDLFRSIKISNELKNKNFDIIYTNTRVIFIGAFVAKILGLPHIWHIREFVEENNMRSVFLSDKMIGKLSARIVVISKAVKRVFDNKVDPNKIKLVYNGLSYKIDNFVEKQNKDIKEFKILIAGTIIPAKGQLDAVYALKLLKEKGLNNVKLYIAGSDPEKNNKNSYKSQIVKVINKNSLNNVFFLGEVMDLNKIRADMDIELMCSTNEAFGRVTIEGMQNGLIVIGSNAGATPEIIKNGYNGILYEPGNIIDLAEKIEHIVSDRKYAENIAQNAYIFTLNNFTLEQNLINIKKVIREVSEYKIPN